MELLDQSDTRQDQYDPQDKGSQDSPIKHLMLVHGGNLKVGKDQQKDEQVVNAKRFFNKVSCKKLKRRLSPSEIIDKPIEEQGNRNPKAAEHKGFLDTDRMHLFLKDPHVDEQQDKDQEMKADPEQIGMLQGKILVY